MSNLRKETPLKNLSCATLHKAIHLKFERAIILTFVNPCLVSIPGWIKQKKILILGFGIFGKVHSRPKIWSFENWLQYAINITYNSSTTCKDKWSHQFAQRRIEFCFAQRRIKFCFAQRRIKICFANAESFLAAPIWSDPHTWICIRAAQNQILILRCAKQNLILRCMNTISWHEFDPEVAQQETILHSRIKF